MESQYAVIPSVACSGHTHRNRALFCCAAHFWVAMTQMVADHIRIQHNAFARTNGVYIPPTDDPSPGPERQVAVGNLGLRRG